MPLAHDTQLSLQAAIALVNTASDPDRLSSIADADAFWDQFDYTGVHERTSTELDDLRATRSALRALLTSHRDTAAGIVNTMLAEANALPQLVRHEPWDWHLHATDPDQSWDARIRVETAMAMIDVIRNGEMSRLGVCVADQCDGLVLDLSRNRSRRFCSTACGNRAAVAAYRARKSHGT